MINILMITTRDIYNDGGEKTLMLEKDKILKKYGINIFYFSFRRDVYKYKNTIRNFNIVKQYKTKEIYLNKKSIINDIDEFIKKNNIKIVIISGFWLYLLNDEIKKLKNKYNIKFSLDYQGALEEIKEFNLVKNMKFPSLIFFNIFRYLEKKFILNIADIVEVVSKNAISHIKKSYQDVEHLKFPIVHCGISDYFKESEYLEYRKHWREKLSIDYNEIAFVYAGGISKWQNIDEIIEFAYKYKEAKLFIFTSKNNIKELQRTKKLSNNIILDSLPHEELLSALCAFDYGLLLRDENITNYVAFPNKFSEYLNARLTIVLKNKNIGCFINKIEFENFYILSENLNIKHKRDNTLNYEIILENITYDNIIANLIKAYT